MTDEQTFTMWWLPAREGDCAAVGTRSLWFGIFPTYSSEHGTSNDGKDFGPKLDDHGIYEIVVFVTQKPARGHEHCPPKIWFSAPGEPLRLAAPMDPDGTKNRVISITVPDFRALAARAGQPMGPGGLRMITPLRSQMIFDPLGGCPQTETGSDRRRGPHLFLRVRTVLHRGAVPVPDVHADHRVRVPAVVDAGPAVLHTAVDLVQRIGNRRGEGRIGHRCQRRLAIRGRVGLRGRLRRRSGTRSSGWFDAFKEAKPGAAERNTLISDVALAADPADGVIEPPALPESASRKDPLCGRWVVLAVQVTLQLDVRPALIQPPVQSHERRGRVRWHTMSHMWCRGDRTRVQTKKSKLTLFRSTPSGPRAR